MLAHVLRYSLFILSYLTGPESRSPPPTRAEKGSYYYPGEERSSRYGDRYPEPSEAASVRQRDRPPVLRSVQSTSSFKGGEMSPMDVDMPLRRVREPEYTRQTSLGMDAKRRRTNSLTSDSTPARRGRSPSPLQDRRAPMTTNRYRPDERDTRSRRTSDYGTRSHLIPTMLQDLMDSTPFLHSHH